MAELEWKSQRIYLPLPYAADENLTFAFEHCHYRARGNKRQAHTSSDPSALTCSQSPSWMIVSLYVTCVSLCVLSHRRILMYLIPVKMLLVGAVCSTTLLCMPLWNQTLPVSMYTFLSLLTFVIVITWTWGCWLIYSTRVRIKAPEGYKRAKHLNGHQTNKTFLMLLLMLA